MKVNWKRLMCLIIPLTLFALAVLGLLFQDQTEALLGIRQGVRWFPLVLAMLTGSSALTATAYLMQQNRKSWRALEREKDNLRRSEELYRIFEDFSDAVVFEADPEGDSIRFNPKYSEMFGHPPASDSLKNNMAVLMQAADERDRPALDALFRAYRSLARSFVCEFRLTGDDSMGVWHRLEYRMIMDSEDRLYRLVGKLTNIDREKRSFQSLRTKAESDSLTGLLNHEATRSNIERILADEGYAGQHAMLVIDVDNFKAVNDDFGHPEGDRMLLKLSDGIRSQFRASDIVGRIGGDEFVVFVAHSATEAVIRTKAAELCETLQYLCASEKLERMITCSIGVSLTRGRPMNFDALFREADAALYSAKAAGKNGYHLYKSGPREALAADEVATGSSANINVQLRALLEYMEGGVLLYEIGEQIRVIYASPSYYKMIRSQPYTTAETERMFQYVYAEDEPRLSAALRAGAVTGDVVDTVYRARADGGEIHWRHIRAVRIPYQESPHPVLIAVITDVTALKEQEKKLMDNEELLKLALEQTDLRIWTYDPKKNELTGPKLGRVYSDLPESNIISGVTHPDSAEEYRAFYRKIHEGQPFGSCVIRQNIFNVSYDWLRLSYRNLYDENGVAYQAIGVTELLPSVDVARERFEQQDSFLNSIAGELMMTVRYNLTRESMERCWFADPELWTDVDGSKPHSLLDAIYARALTAQDKRLVMDRLPTQRQMSLYESGEAGDSLEFRIVGRRGEILWTSCWNSYLLEPVSGDVYVISAFRNVDRRKRWELSLSQRIERDAATGLYTRRITEAMIKRVLRAEKRNLRHCAMLLLAVDTLERDTGFVNARIQERVIAEIGWRLFMAFDGAYVVGRQDSDIFLIFTPDAGTEAQIRQLSARVLELVNAPYIRSLHHGRIRCLIGTAYGLTDHYSYDMLLSLCESSLADARADGSRDKQQIERIRRRGGESDDWTIMPRNTVGSELSRQAERTLLSCAASIVRSEQPEDSLPDILSAIGVYFGAERAFVMVYHPQSETVETISEWLMPGQGRIMDQMQDVAMSELPVVERAFNERASVLYGKPDAAQRYLCVPVLLNDTVRGFLCVENPTRGLDDCGLIETVGELYMARVVRRDRRLNTSIRVDALTELRDASGYSAFVEETNPDALSSLGVLSMDVNGLDACNREFGKQFGDKLLQFIARTLHNVFSGHKTFRIAGDEFLVLALNLTQASFSAHVEEVIRRCDTAFPDMISVGHTWADEQLSFPKLVEHAQGRMLLAKQPYYRRLEDKGERARPDRLRNLLRFIENGQFRLYLQPKICIKTGECVGAEALVRFYDPEQDLIVTPDMFVPQLEKESIIQLLDLHVFDMALKLLTAWRREGRPIMPLSVNFSRVTALDTVAIARMREIHAGYDIPHELIEIELTERIGELERETVVEACRALSDMGYPLALDDFGSEYSSLSMLPAIHFDTLKLDRSIIGSLVNNRMGSLIVENSLRLCQETGTACVAEGVETLEQAKLLDIMGCGYAQGYLYDKPMPADLFAEKYMSGDTPAEGED